MNNELYWKSLLLTNNVDSESPSEEALEAFRIKRNAAGTTDDLMTLEMRVANDLATLTGFMFAGITGFYKSGEKCYLLVDLVESRDQWGWFQIATYECSLNHQGVCNFRRTEREKCVSKLGVQGRGSSSLWRKKIRDIFLSLSRLLLQKC